MNEEPPTQRTIRLLYSPTPSACVVAVILALPRKLDRWSSVPLPVATVQPASKRNHPELAELIVAKLDVGGSHHVERIAVPDLSPGNAPPADKLEPRSSLAHAPKHALSRRRSSSVTPAIDRLRLCSSSPASEPQPGPGRRPSGAMGTAGEAWGLELVTTEAV
jgi:hypothetical protein